MIAGKEDKSCLFKLVRKSVLRPIFNPLRGLQNIKFDRGLRMDGVRSFSIGRVYPAYGKKNDWAENTRIGSATDQAQWDSRIRAAFSEGSTSVSRDVVIYMIGSWSEPIDSPKIHHGYRSEFWRS
jgi:hypothetical protein